MIIYKLSALRISILLKKVNWGLPLNMILFKDQRLHLEKERTERVYSKRVC
jgi:hypothetical protein